LIVVAALAVAATLVGCGGSPLVPQATSSVDITHRYAYPPSAVGRFVRSGEMSTVSMPIRLCVAGRFEDEMPYGQFASLVGTGALIDRAIQFAAQCAGGG
jgi:hypothetical protein